MRTTRTSRVATAAAKGMGLMPFAPIAAAPEALSREKSGGKESGDQVHTMRRGATGNSSGSSPAFGMPLDGCARPT